MDRIYFFYFAIELWGAFFSIVAAAVVAITRNYDRTASRKLIIILISSVLFLLSDSLSWFFRGDTSPLGFTMVSVTYFANLMLGFVTLSTMGSYFAYIVCRGTGIKQRLYKVITHSLMTAGALFLVVSRFFNWIYSFDESNNIRIEAFNKVPTLFCLAFMFVTLAYFLRYYRFLKKLEAYAIMSMVTILIVVMLFQVLDFSIPFIDLSFIVIVLILVIAYEQKYTGYMVEQQNRLNESRIALFNRQLKPHFIFNSLSAIRALCRNSPEGVEAINDFSYFIRESIDMLNNDECINAEREFTTVEHYMNIITKRFDDGITVKYNIENVDFVLPSFCVQTLVENSVRHGIRRRENRVGVITINSYIDGDNNIIDIIDDGVGFDPSQSSDTDDAHIGINNTRERLSLMCSGRLEISSVRGEGTVARIIIPRTK